MLGTTGNVLTLDSDGTQTVTARVTNASGTPVADGTPITWTVQKGGVQTRWTQVTGNFNLSAHSMIVG